TWESINTNSLDYNNKLATLGIHETNNKYLSLGFEVTDNSQVSLRIIQGADTQNLKAEKPYIVDKMDTSDITFNPDDNNVNPNKKPPTTGPDSGNPPNVDPAPVSLEDLFSLTLIEYSYDEYRLNIDYSLASNRALELENVNIGSTQYDKSSPNWHNDTANSVLTVTFDNLLPDTEYSYYFVFLDNIGNKYISSTYTFRTKLKEFSTATGNHYIPGPGKVNNYSNETSYCTYTGHVDIEPNNGSFYIPYDPSTQKCIYDKVNGSKNIGPVFLMSSNDMDKYVDMSEVNPDFDYAGYLNEVSKSDGKIPILVPQAESKGTIHKGDVIDGIDFNKHGKDLFAPNETDFQIYSQFYVYDEVNVPVNYFGTLIPIDDPDFMYNQSYDESTGNIVEHSNKPVNSNNNNMLTRGFTNKDGNGLISKSGDVSESFKTLSVGIRVKEDVGGSFGNSNLFSETLSFNLFELVSGETSSKKYKFDVNNSDKIISNKNYQRIDNLIYAISQIDNISLGNIGDIILAINSLNFSSLTVPGNGSIPNDEVVVSRGRDKGKFTADGVVYQNQIIDWYNEYMYYAMKNIEPDVYKLNYVKDGDELGGNLPYNLKNPPTLGETNTAVGKIEVVLLRLIDGRMVTNSFFINDFYISVYKYQNGLNYTPSSSINPTDPTRLLGVVNASSMEGRSNIKLLIGKLLTTDFLYNIQAFNGSYIDLISTTFLKTENIGIYVDKVIYKFTYPLLESKQSLVNALFILGLIVSTLLLALMLSIYINSSKKEINILKSIGWGSKSIFVSDAYNILVYSISIVIGLLISKYVLGLISTGLGIVAGTFPISILLSTPAILALVFAIFALILFIYTYKIYLYNTAKIDKESIA
ncbi:MAG: ABC transporter permease, partial [Mycoplasmataceae bacterium]|nr:ABC transporter permease [Mycoplasmataceae bacterium]